jgi:hypothetical protein
MKWIDSNGGPLLFLEKKLFSIWHGIDLCKGSQTDYERACGIYDFIGIIPVGQGYALVLGDEPMHTAWIPNSDLSGGMIARIVYTESEEAVNRMLGKNEIKFQKSITDDIIFEIDSRDLCIFDSSYAFSDTAIDKIEFELSPGKYTVNTFFFEPNSLNKVLIHKLVLMKL